jgi:hypothetical protein
MITVMAGIAALHPPQRELNTWRTKMNQASTYDIVKFVGLFIVAYALTYALKFLLEYDSPRITDKDGHPVLRCFPSACVMTFCGFFVMAVGIYQWFIPLNHHYSGNLLILSYTPIFLGVLVLCFAIHLFKYKVVLVNGEIVVHRWPFSCVHYEMAQFERVENYPKATILHFSGNRKFNIFFMHSGRSYFLSQLNLNSLKIPPSFPK